MKNIVINFASQAWVALMGVVFVPIYIRFLGEEAYGLIGFFTVMSIFLHTISMGIVPTLTREMTQVRANLERQQEILDLKLSIERIAILFALSIAGTFVWMSNKIATDWLKPESIDFETVKTSVQIMGVIISIRLIEAIYRSVLIGLGQVSQFAKITAGMATVRGIGAILVLYLFDSSIVAFFIWNLATTILTILAQKKAVTRDLGRLALKGRFQITAISRIGGFAVGMMLVTVTGSVFSQIDKLFLSNMLSLPEYGRYTISSTLAATILMAVSPLNQAIFPELSRLFFDRDKCGFRALYIWSSRLVVILTTSFGSLLAINSGQVLKVWTGSAIVDSQTDLVFALLCVSFVINSFSWIPQQVQFSMGNTKTTIKLNSYLSVFIAIFLIPVVSAFGTFGCAVLLVVANLIYVTAYFTIVKREFIQRKFWAFIWSDVAFPALACVSCIVIWKVFFIVIPLKIPALYQFGIEGATTAGLMLITYGYITKQHLKWG